jgi:hypothetical protein
MGDVFHLSDVIGESGEPSSRAALARMSSALAQTEGEIEGVLVGKTKLESEMGKEAGLKQDLAERIVAEAASVIAAMKSGAQWALGRCGSRGTLKAAELLSASSIQTAIGEATIKEAADELQRLENKRERLLVARAGIIREVVRESLQPALLADYAVTLTQLQLDMTRLAAMRRFLEPQSHEYRPEAARLAVTLPDFAHGSGETAVVATAAAIGRVETILAQFFADLERDPRAPVPELEVDALDDPSTPYHALSGPERAEIDRAFVPPVNTHRRTIDAELFEEQAAAKFAAITN